MVCVSSRATNTERPEGCAYSFHHALWLCPYHHRRRRRYPDGEYQPRGGTCSSAHRRSSPSRSWRSVKRKSWGESRTKGARKETSCLTLVSANSLMSSMPSTV